LGFELEKEEFEMLDELKEEEIVKKVGGRFKLSSLIQKRMVVLTKNAMEIVVQEIIQDKIYLDASGAVMTRSDENRERHFSSGPSLDDM
jgi:DNA-directed RNA polymerase subunit omega